MTPGGTGTTYPQRIQLPAAAEAYIDQLGTDLLLGRLELHQLPPSLHQLWTFAWQQGRDSLRCEVERLRTDCDRLHLIAYNKPAAVREIRARRMDAHYADECARFFAGATR
jgi:hypothetical protein